ncbi:MAG TPA: RidA family protein [Kofleriaceae bacterium]|nr:RidA family protein [Kofleriaceae bacterium]
MKIINPKGFPPARGYSNGIVVPSGRTMYVSGQIGWEADGSFASDDLAAQFARALDNVLAVVAAEGGGARQIAQMTVFVTDVAAYRDARAELGKIWRERFGQYYPAMTLVEITRLVEPRARVEIQAVAIL